MITPRKNGNEFALKFRVIADTRDYRGIIDGSVVPPDELAVITITAEDTGAVLKEKKDKLKARKANKIGYRDLVMSTEGISFTIVENAVSEELPSGDLKKAWDDYELFLLRKEIDAPNGNLNHQDTHNCENQDDILIHATILSHTFALPQLMAEHNCEDLEPSDDPSTVLTTIQATSDQTRCAHNPMATQCNQSPYPNHNFALPPWHHPTLRPRTH